MLSKKLQLLESTTKNLGKAVAIGMAVGALTGSGVRAQVKPSPPTVAPVPNAIEQPIKTNPIQPIDNRSKPTVLPAPNSVQPIDTTTPKPIDNQNKSIRVDTISGAAETALVEYFATKSVKFYGAYWCDHCQKQKSLFGAAAAAKLTYIECAVDGANSQRKLCKQNNIKMFPTWEIDGQYYPGTKDLKELAKMSGYQGPMNFKYRK